MKKIRISGSRELHIHNDRFSVYTGELRLFMFYVSSPVSLPGKEDEDGSVELISCDDDIFVWRAESSLWERKEYRLYVRDGAFLFTVKVKGSGAPEQIDFFRSPSGSKFNAAGYTLFNLQQLDGERSKFLTDTGYAELKPLRAAPPPYVFPFFNDYNSDVAGIGIAAKRGEHNFHGFSFHAPADGWNENPCWFSLELGGYTYIDGEWESPAVIGVFGESDLSVLRKYSEWQYRHRGFGRNPSVYPEWYKKPLFCGWGAQCDLRGQNPGFVSKDFASEKYYNDFCEKLDAVGLSPAAIIIDDKWQKEYGTLRPDTEKWGSLRAFADAQHAKGRRVLLWFKCWDREGLPDDECIFLDGEPFCADPTNPKYLARLRESIRLLLSDEKDGCNCDGFKIDFMDCIPRVPGAVLYEKGVWGLELMKRLFSAIYTAAKEAKPDALINMSSLHPYFTEVCDQFRIHDYNANVRSPLSTMRYRAALADAVMPGIPVDMDGFRGRTKYETMRILLAQPEIGVPDLYYFPDDFTAEDWERVKIAWDKY